MHAAYCTRHGLTRDVPFAAELGRGLRVRRNVWFGAAGATTALHFDPSDNWLCQIAGFKYVRLYAARYTPLVPPETREQPRVENEMLRSRGNFSLADVESPNLATAKRERGRRPRVVVGWGGAVVGHVTRTLRAAPAVLVRQ